MFERNIVAKTLKSYLYLAKYNHEENQEKEKFRATLLIEQLTILML